MSLASTHPRRPRDPLAAVRPFPEEIAAALPGDDVVPAADVVMDRAFTLPGGVEEVWPWFVQLGKARSGWYLPRAVERLLPCARRGIRGIDPRFQGLAAGDVIPDWGGRDETFEVVRVAPPHVIVHRSQRRGTGVSWAIVLRDVGPGATRVQLRLRLGPVKHRVLAERVGGLFDLLTIVGLAAGLRERLAQGAR